MKNTVESIEKRLYKVEELQTKVAELSGTVNDLSNKIVQLNNKVNEFNKIMESNNVIVGHFVIDVIRMVTPSNKGNKQLFAQKIQERFTHHKLELYSPELVAINETKCNDVSFRKLFAIHKLEGYKIEHKERKNGQGGGFFRTTTLQKTEPKKEFFEKLYESKVDFVLAGDLNSKKKFNQFITESLVFAATNSIPTFKTRNFKKTLPYYILELNDQEHRAKNRLKKHNNPENKARFNLFTKLVREEIAAFRDKKWQDYLDKINKNVVSSKHFWRKVNRNRNDSKKSSKNYQFPKLTYDGKEYKIEMEKVELFGKLLEETFKDKN
ncbi:hypothetical protein BpHYR1_027241 [Brachionus plicatilis]|uniref:RNA-directed DNA polymerase from mobile element jockey-like n=1 Tax=Brachionus plicatilis TaxID=10195 RepID=A0A3M7SNP1_BRAPC|nr:hypothetical protein BpHYR1_027241 [Brachionus plicatilis]